MNGSGFISGATVADYSIVWANIEPGSGARGGRGFIVDTRSAGFSVPRTDRKMGVRGVPTGHLRLDNVRVPAERLVGGAAAVDAAVGGGSAPRWRR